MDDEFDLGGLGFDDEEGEETASITAAAQQGALSSLPEVSKYALEEYKAAQEAYKKAYTGESGVLAQIQKARKILESQPTQKTRGEYVRGLAQALTKPKESTDPRFYERRNLYTFLRDVGEYGSAEEKARKEAELKQKLDLLKLDELAAKYGQEEAGKRFTLASQLLRAQRAGAGKDQGETARTRALREEAKARGMTLEQFLKWKDEQDKEKKDKEGGLSPADIRSIRLEVASTLSGPKDRLTIINEGLSNLSLAIKGNPQAEAQLNRSLATISGDKQLSLAEVESVVGAGSFAQRVSNAISKFFTGGAGDLTNEQKKELLETYEAYYANQYNNSRNRLKNIYIGAGYTTLPEDMFDSPYISVTEKRRRKAEKDAEAAAEKAKSEATSISLSGGKKVRPVGQ